MSFCELVLSVMKDTVEEPLIISQKNHKLLEDSQRNHTELLKTMEAAWQERSDCSLEEIVAWKTFRSAYL